MSAELRSLMHATATVAPKAVQTEHWGTVYVRAITVAELEDQDVDTADWKNKRKIARAAARVICDAGGGLVFDPEDRDDVELIARQPWPLLKQVVDAAETFNAATPKAAEEAKNG